jgi:N-acetylmuramoyl-L-alanine amidase
MREIKYIVLHCTATGQTATVESIKKYWKLDLGWKNPGYHFLIEKDGKIHNLQPIERPSNGVAGYNQNSIHISYIGGIDDQRKGLDNRTPKQILSQLKLIIEMKDKFPNAEILGHRDFPNVKKECPSFDVKKWLKAVGF